MNYRRLTRRFTGEYRAFEALSCRLNSEGSSGGKTPQARRNLTIEKGANENENY
jgi:hypothetical protein